jgi:hypothetical protein
MPILAERACEINPCRPSIDQQPLRSPSPPDTSHGGAAPVMAEVTSDFPKFELRESYSSPKRATRRGGECGRVRGGTFRAEAAGT